MSKEDIARMNADHKIASENGRKGGKNVTLARRLASRKWCDKKCEIYPCMWQPRSKDYPVEKTVRGKVKVKYECALNKQAPILQKKFYKLCNGKKDDFMMIMNEALTKISSPSELIKYGEKVHKMRFGELHKQEITSRVDENLDKLFESLETPVKEKEEVDEDKVE